MFSFSSYCLKLITPDRGLATTKVLARQHAKVYIASRSVPKAELAIKEIKKEVPDANVAVIEMDLSDLDSVKRGAEEFLKQGLSLPIGARLEQLS